MSNHVKIWIDGSVQYAQGPGGWAALIEDSGGRVGVYGVLASTTSNRAELTAVVRALRLVPPGSVVEILTDSRYVERVVRALQTDKANLSVLANPDLLTPLLFLMANQTIRTTWVRGHNGVDENEFVDQLSRFAWKSPQVLEGLEEFNGTCIRKIL